MHKKLIIVDKVTKALHWAETGLKVIAEAGKQELIYIFDEHGNMYGDLRDASRVNDVGPNVKHTSFLGPDKPVVAAGTLITDADGRLLAITDDSGHFGSSLLKRATCSVERLMLW